MTSSVMAQLRNFLSSVRVIYLSLCYNHFTSWNTVFDSACEPMFWIVDHSARIIGPFMVTLVVLLTTLVVMVTYVCIFPLIFYQIDIFWSLVHLVFSHWLLINIIFNYIMAAFTKPGQPPQAITEVVSICKKCISPKPPRTHHCTVCNACIMKMDHHCPWINNCVGFYNHRYFFQYVAYMWLGTLYVSFAGYDVFKQHFFGNKELIVPAFFFPINMVYHAWQTSKENVSKETIHQGSDEIKATLEDQFFHNVVILQFLLCAGASVALGALGTWHARLISLGQTSIEQHINSKERARMRKKGLVFRNPYHFGFWKNWKLFFGLGRRGRSFFFHVLLPSRHDPVGNGITWTTSTFNLERSYFLDLL